ncbi:MAG: Ig-like domain-containing protein [Chitinispirillia bacterium]|nr:Ig-like domain-containing protein [Chitinispirillia bacterium]
MKKPSSVIGMMLLACAILTQSLFAQGAAGPMQVERLNRGLIAVRQGQGYYLSWRLLANEPYNTGFNVYRGATRLNSTPITGATIYTDANTPVQTGTSTYTVRAVVGGTEQAASDPAILIANTEGANAGYMQINLQRPPTGAQGGTYSPGDGSVGDLTGNGVYDIVIKWDPSNQQDNSNNGITDNVIIDAYTLTGTRLWRIDLGPNIRAGAHYTQFMVYDFDGCGKAEMIVKTAPGTRDGTGQFLRTGPAAGANHSAIHRNANGHIVTGPEYLTVFDGETGRELSTVEYWPLAGTVSNWGGAGRDNGGNRVNRFNAVVAYLDGQRPSAVFQRGYYERMTFAAWDWRNGQLTRRWTFDTGVCTDTRNPYCGQGNHSLSVADVDNSGRHSIITGAAVIKYDGTGLWTSGLGHGDALHVAHMIKDNPIPQVYTPQESGSVGVSLRHANNGNAIFSVNNSSDVGRAVAAHLDANFPGFQFWASGGMGLYDMTGRVIGNLPNNGNNSTPGGNLSINHVVWWAGTLSRQTLDGDKIASWDIRTNTGSRLLTANGASSINGSKANPVLQADIFGDWREEVIWAVGNNAIRIYTTTMPTTHRLVTMMHDPTYRVAVAWQNSSYNQPPHPGYYIASDMNFPPPALNVAVVGGSGTTPNPNPTVALSAPANNSRFWPGQTINITATASVSSGSISRVEFFNGTTRLGERTAAPYTFAWTNPPAGVHTITARAATAAGANATSAAREVTVAALIGSGTSFIDSLAILDPANAAGWSVNQNFRTGVRVYGDREFLTGSTIPAQLLGAEWVSASQETRRLSSPDTLVRFRMRRAGTVFIAHEDRISPRPAWLAARGFTATSTRLTLNDNTADRTFTVYSRTALAGELVALGPNSNDGTTTSMMYLIAARETGTTSALDRVLPASYALNVSHAGNSGVININYAIKDKGAVQLDLFNVKGKKVRTLVSTTKDAGIYSERLSAGGLSAGTYFVKLRAGSQVLQERVLIAK